MTTVTAEALAAIASATTDGTDLLLIEQLARPVFLDVAEVLRAHGGRYARGKYRFPGPAADVQAKIVAAGTAKPVEGWYPTPAPVVARILLAAELAEGMTVLEPSAGLGAIAQPAAEQFGCLVDVVEIDRGRLAHLRASGLYRMSVRGDFLRMTAQAGGIYQRILMNPPFARTPDTGWQDVAHIGHAWRFLRPGGRLVAIASAGVGFRDDKQTKAFRAHIDECGGSIDPLPADAFHESGTEIRTCLITIPA